MKFGILTFISANFLVGCAGLDSKKPEPPSTMQFYDGPSRPKDEIAVLSQGRPFWINNINSQYIDRYKTDQIELLPGEYGIRIQFEQNSDDPTRPNDPNRWIWTHSKADYLCIFEAKANGHYQSAGKIDGNSWVSGIVDEQGNDVSSCRIPPHRMGYGPLIDKFNSFEILVEYEVPERLIGTVSGLLYAKKKDSKPFIYIRYSDGISERIFDGWEGRDLIRYACREENEPAYIFEIPKKLDDRGKLMIYPKNNWRIGFYDHREVHLTDQTARVETILLRPKKSSLSAPD